MARSTPEERTRFSIGDWVAVTGCAYCEQDLSGNRTYKSLEYMRSKIGQVVGATRLMTGTRYSGSLSNYGEDYDPPCFYSDGSVLVWLVRCSVTGKPRKCFAEQLTPCEPRERLPWRTGV